MAYQINVKCQMSWNINVKCQMSKINQFSVFCKEERTLINSLLRGRDPLCIVIQFPGPIILLKWILCEVPMFLCWKFMFSGEPVPANNPPGRNSQKHATDSEGGFKIQNQKTSQFAKCLKNLFEKCPGNEQPCQSILWPPHQLKLLPSFCCCFAFVLLSRI